MCKINALHQWPIVISCHTLNQIVRICIQIYNRCYVTQHLTVGGPNYSAATCRQDTLSNTA